MGSLNMRIDDSLKEESKKVFDALGLDLTSGITLYLKQVVLNQGVPFELTLKKPDIVTAMEEYRQGKGKVFESVEDLMKDLNEDED